MKTLKLKLFLIVLLFVSFSEFLSSQEASDLKMKEYFPFSVWYSGGKARAPMLSKITENSEKEWRADLLQIKELGFNTVRTWVEWSTCEPERGKYNFDNLRLLMRLADEVGLRVIIQVYVDSAPDWVAQEFPHALYETQSGNKVLPQSAPGACTDNSDYGEEVLDFYTEIAKVAVSYPNFFGWDLWSEPHIINWSAIDYVANVQFCYCPGTKDKFRNWLMDKYGSIENLNQAWHRNFTEWNLVDPPRFSTILSYTDFIDWKTFIYEKLQSDMQNRYNAIRKADPNHLITAHAVGASLFQSPHNGYGATDDFLMAKPLDYYGVSIYPKHNHPDRAWSVTTLQTVMDFTRSANREKGGWYVGELQAGKGTISLLISDPVTADDHRIWAWSAIAKGAKGVNIYAYYPMSSGYEADGYGLINLDGSLTDRAIKAGEIAEIVDRNQSLFLTSTPEKAQIGIVYNPLSQMTGGMQRRDYPGALTNSLIGYFQSFSNHNIPVDFIHREHVEKNELSQYKLLIVPYPVMFTREAAEGLHEFVENGGYVLAEARLAWNDESGYASEIIPGLGLHEVFGVRENEVRMGENISLTLTDNVHPVLEGLNVGDKLKGSLFEQSLTPLAGHKIDVLATTSDGSPALVNTTFGKGEAMLAGSYLGMGNFSEVDTINDKFFVNLLKWASIDRPFTTTLDGRSSKQVEVRLQRNNHSSIIYIINHSDEDEEITINLDVDKSGDFSIRSIIENEVKTQKSNGDVLELKTSIAPNRVIAWEISPK
ncbi:MAG: beta-galactosidase [Dysgonamonadaceae bacterium]|nr:beta-galactosidase [Candidatus Nanoarchaeia archaeon]MDD4247237.1 beta-galactosidase [Dysgonamonadaceae bacterium]